MLTQVNEIVVGFILKPSESGKYSRLDVLLMAAGWMPALKPAGELPIQNNISALVLIVHSYRSTGS